MKKLISAAALSTGLVLLSGCGNLLWPSDGNTATVSAVPPLSLRAGTFTSAADSAGPDPLVVSVTTSETAILSVEVVSHTDTIGQIGMDDVVIDMPALIVEANSTGVDTISGATITSRAILTAVENALVNEAGADVEALRAGGPGVGLSTFARGPVIGIGSGGFGGDIELFVNFSSTGIMSVAVSDHNETEPGQNALPTLIAQAEERGSANVDVVTGATLTSNAFRAALNDAIAQALVDPAMAESMGITPAAGLADAADGTYVASAEGFDSTVEVTLTIAGGEIVDMSVTEDDTPEVGGQSVAPMIERILAAQSTDVDIVSGASFTSKAIIKATDAAIAMAAGGAPAPAEEPTATSTTFDLTGVNDGTFFGRGAGRNEEVDLGVTFENGTITTIAVLHEAETPEIGGAALPKLIEQLITAGETDVVSGASLTSAGFIEAIQDAIAHSVANVPFEVTGYDYDTVAQEQAIPAPTVTADAAPAPAETTAAAEPTPAPVATRFTAGTHTGSAQGFKSTVTVTITTDADRITAVSISHDDTPEIADDAVGPMRDRIMSAQSASVDTFSGATMTSSAIRTAAGQAITAASN